MSEWISVKDKLPQHDQEVLVCYKWFDEYRISICNIDTKSFDCIWLNPVGFGGYDWEYDFNWQDVAYWMSLPDLPKQ